jgi:succinoglycan biosynthesis transport protein ExoP
LDIRHYLSILLRHKWTIVLTTMATALVAGVVSLTIAPMYTATATVRIAAGTSGRVEYADYMYADRLMNTYAKMITSRPVLEEVRSNLGLRAMPSVEVEVVRDTELLRITAESHVPFVAQSIANALANLLVTQSQNLYTGGGKSAREILHELIAQSEAELSRLRVQRDKLTADNPATPDANQLETLNSSIQLKEQTLALLLAQYENAQLTEAVRANAVSIVELSDLPTDPSKPNKKITVLLGSLIGLAAGLGLALLFENSDSRLHTTEDIRAAAGLPVLGRIPTVANKQGQPHLLSPATSFSIEYEAYRGLRTNLLALGSESRLKTLAVTSADRGEGKSTIIANLALTFAKAGRLVLLVDADLRLPVLHKMFDLPNEAGLSHILNGEAAWDDVVQNTSAPKLNVITSGLSPENPTELLGSTTMQEWLGKAAAQFDLVLIDTPCLLSVTDAAVLSSIVDGMLLVIKRGKTRREEVQAALGQLADVKANVVGTIVNRAEKARKYYYYGERRGRSSMIASVFHAPDR